MADKLFAINFAEDGEQLLPSFFSRPSLSEFEQGCLLWTPFRILSFGSLFSLFFVFFFALSFGICSVPLEFGG